MNDSRQRAGRNLGQQPQFLFLRRRVDWIALDSRREPALCRQSKLVAREATACIVDPAEQFARRLERALLGRYESENHELFAWPICERFNRSRTLGVVLQQET